jgi:hypothetical protein
MRRTAINFNAMNLLFHAGTCRMGGFRRRPLRINGPLRTNEGDDDQPKYKFHGFNAAWVAVLTIGMTRVRARVPDSP